MANIGVCAAACLAGICSPGFALGQIYSVRGGAAKNWNLPAQETALSFPRAEFYAGPAVYWQSLRDADGDAVAGCLLGGAAGVRVYILPSLSLGAEGQYYPGARVKIPLVGYVRQRAFFGVARWNLTPDTRPSLRLELGAGHVHASFRLDLYRGKEETLSAPAFFAGASASFGLGAGWTFDASLRYVRTRKTRFTDFVHFRSHGALQGFAFLSRRF